MTAGQGFFAAEPPGTLFDATSPNRKTLRLPADVWAKVECWRGVAPVRVAALGQVDPDDPLVVRVARLVRQVSSVDAAEIDAEDAARVAREAARSDGRLRRRVLLLLSKGPHRPPDGADAAAAAAGLGRSPWGVLCRLSAGGRSAASLVFRVGPGGAEPLPARIDVRLPVGPGDRQARLEEYHERVEVLLREPPPPPPLRPPRFEPPRPESRRLDGHGLDGHGLDGHGLDGGNPPR